MSKKSNKSILSSFTIIGAGTFINIILGLITTPTITRIIDPEEYGKMSMFTMYSGMALMVLCMGLDQALVRYYYKRDDDAYKSEILYKCIKVPILSSIIVSTIVLLLACGGVSILKFDIDILVLLCVYTIMQLIYRYSFLLVRLNYDSKLYSTLNVLQKLLYVAIVLGLIFVAKINNFYVLLISTMGALAGCEVISIISQRRIWRKRREHSHNIEVTFKELFRYGCPFIFSMGLMTLFQGIDKIALDTYCSYSEVGVYSSAGNIVSIFAIVQSSFNALWAPMAVEHYDKYPEDKEFHLKGNQIITVIMFFGGFSLIFFKDIFALLLGEKYREAAFLIPFLILEPIMYTISETTVGGIVFKKKSKMHIVITAIACLTNIIGNNILVPVIGSRGAALATGISYFVFLAARTIIANRYYYINFRIKEFIIVTLALIIYAGYNTVYHFNAVIIVGYVLSIVLLIVLYKKTVLFCLEYVINLLKEKIIKTR